VALGAEAPVDVTPGEVALTLESTRPSQEGPAGDEAASGDEAA
jgi:hypothetical protein